MNISAFMAGRHNAVLQRVIMDLYEKFATIL